MIRIIFIPFIITVVLVVYYYILKWSKQIEIERTKDIRFYNNIDDIELYKKILDERITKYQKDYENGIESAKQRLEYFKSQLEKINKINKNK